MLKVYIDGQEGTTGLQIHERLATRDDITVLKIAAEKRKDNDERRRLINEADLVILCLPDDASREAVTLLENAATRVIDASTAFRTHRDWAYGLPEIRKGQRELIRSNRFVANPGCHASALLTAIVPLVDDGLMPADYPLSCTSVTGYSGGGKKLIERYEAGSERGLEAPRHYGLDLNHKHLPEIMHVAGLRYTPVFTPIVADFYKGMAVTVPLHTRLLAKSADARQIHAVLSAHYEGEAFVRVMPFD
ncbi:MAG TPA: N-acetyl-gamma-glutamyl-phosphate reductase, partial [Desulfuromonadales bacterium]|nr:N-acetyl-gamma-glutamyl-phosphate reductase [Desulfuromonadales bacterium]